MKTRKIFQPLFLLMLLMAAGGFTHRAHAQYQSFFGDSITEYSVGWTCPTYDPEFFGVNSGRLIYTLNDTIVFNGNTYLQPTLDELQGDYYIREDTTFGRLYRFEPETDTEYLICDMSLEAGDTFVFPRHPFFSYDMPICGIVDTVVYLNGKKSIIFRTDTANNIPTPLSGYLYLYVWENIPVIFMEGIGPTYSPCGWISDDFREQGGGHFYFMYGSWHCRFEYPLLICVHRDNLLTYMADERAGCYQTQPAKIDEEESAVFKIYPTPVRNNLNVQFQDLLETKGMFYVTNMYGYVVHSQQVEESHFHINVRNLPAGIYVATYFGNGRKSSQKFIKQ